MPTKTHVAKAVFLVLCSSTLAFHNGCSNSGGNAEAPASNGNAVNLSLSTTSGFTAVVADGRSSIPIRLQVTNESGARMSGVSVTFATTAGVLSVSPVVRAAQDTRNASQKAIPKADSNGSVTVTTDTNGIAQALLTASTTVDTAVVTADVLGFRTNIAIAFVHGLPARVQLDASPTSVNTGGNSTLTATVTDANGNLVPGETVTFTFSTNISSATLSAASGVTDNNGQTSVKYTAGITTGADTVQVQVTSGGVVGSTSVTVTVPPEGAGSSLVTSISVTNGATSPVVANGVNAVAISATVQGASGPLPGIPVTLTTTAGSFVALATTAMATTNTNGIATVALIAPTSSGTATVTASSGGFSANTTVTFVAGAAAAVQLAATVQTVNTNGTSTITALVTDAQGNPVSGQTLTFSAPTLGALSVLTGTTDTSGQLTIIYTAGTQTGSDTIRARTVNGVTGTLPITVVSPDGANSIDLLVGSPQLGSNGTGSVTLTALLRDTANNILSDVPVSFRADSGGIQVTNGTTGATGTATAVLTTGGDKRNRIITVTATTGNLSSQNTVQITGTTLSISGASSIVLGRTTRLSILLRDSGGTGIANQPITVSSALGNLLSAITVTTDFTGQTSVDVTGHVAGNDTIQASAFGTTATAPLLISAANFLLTAPAPATQVLLDTPQPVTVHWDQTGVPQAGQPINFFATRGNFVTAPPCPPSPVQVQTPTISATTNAQGDATVTICADNTGPAIISAAANISSGPSSQVEIEFITTTVASLIVQAVPTTLSVNVSGGTTQQSIITAVLRDNKGNLVKNQTVSFSVKDVSGGQIAPPSAVTDSFGRASTLYVAGAAPTAKDGVSITATAGGVTDTLTLTVTQQPLFVTLGTGNQLAAPTTTQYSQPYAVLVNDANGNPVNGATVELNVLPTRYEKGIYVLSFNPTTRACLGWVKLRTVQPTGIPDDDGNDQACENEDSLIAGGIFNGILDPGEDRNNNGRLDPGNVAAAPKTVTTDANGFALFDVVYAKEFTWVEIKLEARAFVAGSEGLSRAQFFLRGIVTDFNNCTVAPPGSISPYGRATTCSCDERTNAVCDASLPDVTIMILNTTPPLPSAGGTFTFTVTGGTQSGYSLSTSLSTVSTNPLSTTQIVFGETFGLLVSTNETGVTRTITVNATDLTNGQVGTISLTQSP